MEKFKWTKENELCIGYDAHLEQLHKMQLEIGKRDSRIMRLELDITALKMRLEWAQEDLKREQRRGDRLERQLW